MITVNFPANTEIITAGEHLYQWDNGQKISISGLSGVVSNLATIDVHFANKVCDMAITVVPSVLGTSIVAPIPNSLLQYGYPIVAYVYVPSDDGSRTIKMVTIPVEPRKRPADFELDEDEAITSLDAINNRVNAVIVALQSDYEVFKEDVEADIQEIVNNVQIENAKTLQGKTADDFVQKLTKWSSGDVKNLLLNSKSGFVFVGVNVTDMPYDGSSWHGVCNCTEESRTIIATAINSADTYVRTYRPATNAWSTWMSLGDGGDADTVDGKHATDFIAHGNAPELRITGRQAITSGNLNTYVDGGAYYISTSAEAQVITNSPTTTMGYALEVYRKGNNAFQIATYWTGIQYRRYTTNASATSPTWSAWIRMADGCDASTVNGVKFSTGTTEAQTDNANGAGYVAVNAWYGQYS